jgi:hypothetical protein
MTLDIIKSLRDGKKGIGQYILILKIKRISGLPKKDQIISLPK